MSDTKQPVQREVTDPVCGMRIDPATAVGREGWRGSTYHFCSSSCQAKFRGRPDQYARPASGC